jgi:sialate O-acetylesterase
MLALVGPGLMTAGLRADVRLPAIFSDHMVLQKSGKVPLWGRADPGEEVTVTFIGQTVRTTAGADGKWMATLDLSDSAPGPFELTIQGKNKLTIRDVVVGEVWVASGQSNMTWMLMDTAGGEAEASASENPRLRQFLVERNPSPQPVEDVAGRWVSASPATSGGFSAAGYYFGKRLQRELQVPVGLIHSSVGGTPAEAWISIGAIESVPELKATSARLWTGRQKADPKKVASHLFNGMVAPLIPYAIRGVIWYQGEHNTGRAWQYRTTFPLLITDWRNRWGQGDFPFYFCQLANHRWKNPEPVESAWAELREAQSATLALPNTGQAVLIDTGEAHDIHPRNKKDAGERLAAIALAKTYGRAVPHAGPACKSVRFEGGKAILDFQQTEGGLIARPVPETFDLKTKTGATAPLIRNSPNSELEGFAICGEDRKWVWARAMIKGDTVVVWAEDVPEPVAVRYGWADNPTCNLYNAAGFPASPFRTDDFPASTLQAKY